MPQLADITVKKADGTTDILWTGVVSSAGDRTASRHASKTVSSIPAFQPQMSVKSEANGDASVRRVHVNIVYPYTVTDSGTNQTTKLGQASFRGEWSVSQEMPQTTVDEFAAQVANLVDSTLLVDVVKAQVAPT